MSRELLGAISDKDLLRLALMLKKPDIIDILNVRGSNNRYILQYALDTGDIGVIDLLVSAGCSLDIPCMPSILEMAAKRENIELIEFLISKGLNPNLYVNGSTIFAQTCEMASVDVIKFLVNKGAKVNEYLHPSDAALSYACRDVHIHTIKVVNYFFDEHEASIPEVLPHILDRVCGYHCDEDIMAILLKNDVNINAKFLDASGNMVTPLQAARSSKYKYADEFIRFLLANGAVDSE